MPRIIILDSFPLSCSGKNKGIPPTITDQCRQWLMDCISAGNLVHVPAIIYYETLRELERPNAAAQIARLRAFCFSAPDRFLPLETRHLEQAARLWAQARNLGTPTSSPDALDGDVILAAQVQALNLPANTYVVAATNVAHIALFVSADHWMNIAPGS